MTEEEAAPPVGEREEEGEGVTCGKFGTICVKMVAMIILKIPKTNHNHLENVSNKVIKT